MKNKLKKIYLIVFVLLITLFSVSVRASDEFENVELSDAYKEWLELPIEQRIHTIPPRAYNISTASIETENELQKFRFGSVGATQQAKFDLRQYISNNLKIKDQGQTGSCWTFGSIASLETNLALKNYYNQKNQSKVYDFSEKHMRYAVTRNFRNSQTNSKGLARSSASGGRPFLSDSYFTNGLGPVDESTLPFDESTDLLDINSVIGKNITANVTDIITFPTPTSSNKEELKQMMKEHIKNNGGIGAGIHGASLALDGSSPAYNNTTGAIYCNNSLLYPSDHYVTIVGWDDDYAVTNFNQNSRPSSPGAWIIKNSWGEKISAGTVSETKKQLYNQNPSYWNAQGYTSPDMIPDSVLQQYLNEGFYIENGNVVVNIGDKGFMYISYEDANVYNMLTGIEKATDEKDYENVYSYADYYMEDIAFAPVSGNRVYTATVFNKRDSKKRK